MTTTRRQFLIGAGVAAGSAAAAGALGPLAKAGRDDEAEKSLAVDRVVRTTCSPNCTGALRTAGVRARRRGGQDPAGRGLPGRRLQPARLHEGALVPQPDLRRGPDHEAADPHRRARLRRVPGGDLGRGPGAGWPAACGRIGEKWGWDSIHVFGQVPGSGYVQKGANYRACALLGMTHGTSFDFNGDLPMGMPITFGVQNAEHEAKDWANSRFLLLVGSNPVETRIPDVHFIFDAVERGAQARRHRPDASPPPPPRPTPTCGSRPGRTRRWRWRCAARSSRTARRLGLHGHVHGRGAARAHGHGRRLRARSWRRGGPGPARASARRVRRGASVGTAPEVKYSGSCRTA